MNPEHFVRITEHDHAWLSKFPATHELAAELEHAYVVPWALFPRDVVTMSSRVAFDDEWFGQ